MPTPVDYRLAVEHLLEVARENGHVMYRVGSIKITHSIDTEHIHGLEGGALWGCRRHSNGCRAAIWTMCSDGTVASLGPKGTIHQVLHTPPTEYDCGVPGKPLIEEPHRFPPSSSTLH